MTDVELVQKTADFVKEKFSEESTGHDWWHMYRVWKLSKHIAKEEKDVNLLVVELAALLHDIADFKLHGGDTEIGPAEARKWLESLKVDKDIIFQVEEIIRSTSFKGAHVKQGLTSIESKIIFDADKIDALGAIGIARAFAFGGAHNRLIHDPAVAPTLHKTFDEYKGATPPTVNHFHEKLLLLKDRMYTKTGKKMAQQRHKYMEEFLEEFHAEWDGKL